MRRSLLLLTSLVLVIIAIFLLKKPFQERFEAPRKDNTPIQFMVGKESTAAGIASNLEYYGFIKDAEALKYALENTQDGTVGREGAIVLDNGNTINTQATYTIAQNMSAWDIAKILLNEGLEETCTRGCPPGLFYPEVFPGGVLAPTLAEQYEWVKTYEDCIKAKGQLTSDQYYEKTGIRKCVSPDGVKEFTEGQEGWVKAVGG